MGGTGGPLQPTAVCFRDRKQVYGQAFAIYALAEHHHATGRREPLNEAIATYRLIESHARARHGGYLEAFGPAWEPIADMRLSEVDMNEPKSQNTHLHVMEAYTRLLALWPDPAPARRAGRTRGDHARPHRQPCDGHLGLCSSRGLDAALRPDLLRPRHRGRLAPHWAAEALGSGARRKRIRPLAVKIADATLAEGVDADGGVFNQGGPGGLTDTNKEWWPQAEAVVGFLNAYQLSREERYLEAALRTWDFIEKRLIDRRSTASGSGA
jgi:cellobiose epimerase